MIRPRVLPCLLLKGEGFVKTIRFKDPRYLGDPRNIMRIFNEKEVDEVVILDITATLENRKPRFDLIREIVSEAFMPVAYGGGLKDVEDIRYLMNIGVEKVIINSYALEHPEFISKAVDAFGGQSIVVSMDVRRGIFGKYNVFTHSGTKNINRDPVSVAIMAEKEGAGEIIVNSIDRDGTMQGYDGDLIKSVASSVKVPVIACGGARGMEDVESVIKESEASAAAAGSIFVYQGKHKAVLISYPDQKELKNIFSTQQVR
jgi:cyclase